MTLGVIVVCKFMCIVKLCDWMDGKLVVGLVVWIGDGMWENVILLLFP